MSRKARVAFSYDAEQEDEISLQVGDIITNIVDKDTGWCEGELNGKRGMFPNNFVEEFFSDGEEAVAPKPDSVAGKKGLVTFDYEAANEDELTLHVNDVVDILGEDEEGWWKGRLHGRTGVFPSNFVEIVEDTMQSKLMSEEKPENVPHHDKLILTTSNEDADQEDGDNKRHSGILSSKKFGGAVGFGNLINAGMLAKRLNKVHHDEKKEEKNEKTDAEKSNQNIGPKSAKMRPAPPVPVTPQTKKPPERAKVISDYDPQDTDELRIRVGDIIRVINKDIADNEGWWEGELGGKFGVFPNNFVELLSSEQNGHTKDKPPDLPPTSKKGVPVLPTRFEGTKTSTVQEKHTSPLPFEQKKGPLVTLEQHTPEKPANKKPPVKKEKPSLPPKKPLPVRKAEAVKKPEKKVDVNEKSKANDDSKEAADVKNAPLRKSSKEDDVSQLVTVRPPSEIRTEDVDEGDISFDGIPETETLNHLTANRAKNPQKRPPSKDGRLTDSTRLSGNLDEQLFNAEYVPPEAPKRIPGRPKEPPKEPAWKREAREARENKVPPATTRKDDHAVEMKKSEREEVQPPVPSAPKGEAVSSVSSADVEKLNKQIAELREAITAMEKKHNEAVKQLEDKFNREIESLINDFDEERKQNAALKVEIDRIKRRQARLDGTESK